MNSTVRDYEAISLIRSDEFGYVVEAYDRINDKRVVIKRTHKVSKILSREYEILSKLKDCEHIIKLLDTFYTIDDKGKIIQNLVLEYGKCSLKVYMDEFRRKKKYIPLDKIKNIASQILLGIDFCHQKNIVHRDIKPENVLFTQDDQVKICGFRCSKFINEKTTSTPIIGSRFYRAPELVLGKIDYNEKIDIFSAGCVIAELFILSPLFPGEKDGLQIFEYMYILGNPRKEYFSKFDLPDNFVNYFDSVNISGIDKFDEVLNEDNNYDKNEMKCAADLILNMLNWDINKRFSAKQCLNHPFLSNKLKVESQIQFQITKKILCNNKILP